MVNYAASLSPLFINGEFIVKTTILAAATVLVSFATPAMAREGKVVAYYDSVWIPAKTEEHKKLHSAAHINWEHRSGQLVEVYYAPVYIQHTHTRTTKVITLKLKLLATSKPLTKCKLRCVHLLCSSFLCV